MNGDATPLREETTKGWIIDRLAEGYATDVFINLKSQAEGIAFSEGAYSEAQRHRHHKTRLDNGPEFQIANYPALKQASLFSAPSSVILEAVSSSRTATPLQLATLSVALWHRGDNKYSSSLAEVAVSSFRTREKLKARDEYSNDSSELIEVIKAGTLNEVIDIRNNLEKGYIDNWPEDAFGTLLFALNLREDIQSLTLLHKEIRAEGRRNRVEEALVRTAVVQEVDLSRLVDSMGFKLNGRGTLLKCLLENDDSKSIETFYPPESTPTYVVDYKERGFSEWFIETLQTLRESKRIVLMASTNMWRRR